MTSDEIVTQLSAFISHEVLHGEEEVEPHTPLLALGVLDSLSMVTLLDFIERSFDVAVPNDSVTVENFEDVSAMAALVARRMGSAPVATDARPQTAMERAVHTLRAANVTSEWHAMADRNLHLLSVDGPEGVPWLMLPGLGNPASSWGNLLKAVMGVNNASAVDLAGFGLSTGAESPHYLDHVGDIERLIAERFDGRVVLVCSSAGSLIGLELARRCPEQIEALVLVGFGIPADPAGWLNDLEGLWRQPEAFLERTYHEPPKVNQFMLEQFEATYGMKAYHSYLTVDDLNDAAYRDVTVPVLILGGSSDEIIGMPTIRAACEHLPQAELVELARCGHFPGSERPEETVYSIQQFLRSKGLG